MKIIAYGDTIKMSEYVFHSKFTNVLNFVNNEKELLSIASKTNYLAPNSIIFNEIENITFNKIKIHDNFLFVNNTPIPFGLNQKYHSKIEIPALSENIIKKQINKIFILKNFFPEKSLFFIFDETRKSYFKTSFDNAFVKIIDEGISEIKNKSLVDGLKKIKGCGHGLTPSGDDFVAGIIFSTFFIEKQFNVDLQNLREQFFEIAASNNLFSMNFLTLAKNGCYFKRLKEFLLIFYKIESGSLKDALINLFSIGETSGADLLTGFIFGLKIFLEKNC